ncbi:hypothetical protein BZA05DRAFT_451583 [Tricharina praecox]|uniref:uncharacterized protein n=1 Tax=Tricharina praecox TaxID=43433 RepID=UPI00221F84A0|nr:uncharacterized protein BZA05DRAFT_451583 [Tricharina praecox]KAI5853397.1 hypothetical protein BZA05DRAFT_451583 [Tricharina praecox]
MSPTPRPTLTHLLRHLSRSPPLHNPRHPRSASLTATISSASLHPTLEAALHLLNGDLPSAHFLVRHMQSPPAVEGMLLHGILHRIEGDYDNARAWYSDVDQAGAEVLGVAWVGGKEGGKGGGEGGGGWSGFIDAVERSKREGREEREDVALVEEGGRELNAVLEFCRKRFGDGEVLDASDAWVRPSEKIKNMGQGQVTGDQQRAMF